MENQQEMRELSLDELSLISGGTDCYYGGERYSDGSRMTQENTVMVCDAGTWKAA